MPSPPADTGAHRPRWTRRHLLVGGLALAGSGCTLSDPAVRGGSPSTSPTTASPTPRPTPPAPAPAPVSVETRLAALAAAVAAAPGQRTARSAALVDLVRRCHLERAAALAAPDPAARPAATGTTTPSPSPEPRSGRRVAVQRLVRAERRAAREYRRSALASDGLTALLLGSMAVASGRFGSALTAGDPPAVAALRPHRPTALVSDTEALAAMVTSLHALVFGYQLALGRLRLGSAAHARARAGLRDRRLLLRRLSDALVAAGAEVPAAAPAYDPSPEPTNARTAALLIRRMESALLPFCGLWLAAAARATDRTLALDTLSATVATAEAWGGPLLPWPGYQD